MALLTLVLFAALELEDNDLRSPTDLYNRARDSSALHKRSANTNPLVTSGDQYFFELNRVTGILAGEEREAHYLSGAYPKLFSARANDCECHCRNTPVSIK